MLESIAQKSPVGRDAITGVIQGMQQRQILAPRNALVSMAQRKQSQGLPVNPLLAAAVSGQPGDDKRRRQPP